MRCPASAPQPRLRSPADNARHPTVRPSTKTGQSDRKRRASPRQVVLVVGLGKFAWLDDVVRDGGRDIRGWSCVHGRMPPALLGRFCWLANRGRLRAETRAAVVSNALGCQLTCSTANAVSGARQPWAIRVAMPSDNGGCTTLAGRDLSWIAARWTDAGSANRCRRGSALVTSGTRTESGF